MCQRDVGFFRHLPIAYADKKCGPQSLGGRHGITPTGRAIPSVVAPQQSHRPLHPTREVRHTLGIVEPHPYLRLGYEGCIAISGSTTRGCIAILGSIKRVYSQFRFSAPKCIAISGRSNLGCQHHRKTHRIHPNQHVERGHQHSIGHSRCEDHSGIFRNGGSFGHTDGSFPARRTRFGSSNGRTGSPVDQP